TYDLVRVLAGRRRALLAAAVLATAPIVLAYARLVIFDMPLTALVTAALDCLVRARTEGNAWRWLPLAGLAMGLAALTKGPVGIAVPLLAWFAARGALARPARPSGAGPILAGAAGVLVVFFTCSASKRPHYILPALVPLALLAAVGIAAEPGRALAVVRAIGRWTAVAGAVALVAALVGFEGRGGNFDVLAPQALAPAGLFLLGWGAAAAAGRRPAAALVACALDRKSV